MVQMINIKIIQFIQQSILPVVCEGVSVGFVEFMSSSVFSTLRKSMNRRNIRPNFTASMVVFNLSIPQILKVYVPQNRLLSQIK